MKVIFLAAGVGTRLRPLTNNVPKCLFKIGRDETVIGRMVKMVKKHIDAQIYVVTGFMHEKVESSLSGVTFIYNPFYRITNSIVSLWFAQEHLDDDVIIINADVVIEEAILVEFMKTQDVVMMDSSKISSADYKVATYNNRVVMMSKELSKYAGEYAGMSKLSHQSAIVLKHKINEMIQNDQFDEWYENALVNMILDDEFILNVCDVAQLRWVEVDRVDDLPIAHEINDGDRLDG
jgi:choline kinase